MQNRLVHVRPKLQFKQLLVNSPTAKEYLQKEVTIFAPSDAYMEKYNGPKDEQFILNHIGARTIFNFKVINVL